MDSPTKSPKSSSFGFKNVEPAMLLITFSASIIGILSTNLIELQYCYYYLDIDEKVCLNSSAPHFTEMQKYVSTFTTFIMILTSVIPAVISVFMGPWSDTHGRRPLLLSGSIGLLLAIFLWAWGIYIKSHPYCTLLFDLPFALAGGGAVVNLGIYCYLCDHTTSEQRAFRLGILQSFSYIGTFVGTLGTPYLVGVSYMFAVLVAGSVAVALFLYILIFLREPTFEMKTEQKAIISKNPFQLALLKSLYETCYVNQSPNTVQLLAFSGSIIFVSAMETAGEIGVLYLYLQNAFDWTITEWTYLNILMTVVSALSSCVLTSRILGLTDIQVMSLVVGIRTLSATLLFFAQHNWIIFAAGAFGGISGVSRVAGRSFLSKIIDPNDVGKVYAMCGLLEALGPLFGSTVFNTVYRMTLGLHKFPSYFFLISIFLCTTMALQTWFLNRSFSHRSEISKTKKLPTIT